MPINFREHNKLHDQKYTLLLKHNNALCITVEILVLYHCDYIRPAEEECNNNGAVVLCNTTCYCDTISTSKFGVVGIGYAIQSDS